ncbi:hypothetical protein LINPERPRIM_LOCUS30806 [Linum perenne]
MLQLSTTSKDFVPEIPNLLSTPNHAASQFPLPNY